VVRLPAVEDRDRCEEAQEARRLFEQGESLLDANSYAAVLDPYGSVIDQFRVDSDAELRWFVDSALLGRAYALKQLGRYAQALGDYDELLSRREGAPNDVPEVSSGLASREIVAEAVFQRAEALFEVGRLDEALAAYERVVDEFGSETEPRLRVFAAASLNNKAFRLGTFGRIREALEASDEVIRRFSGAREPELRASLARAILNKGGFLLQLRRHREAISAWDELVSVLGEAAEPSIHLDVGQALFNKARVLEDLGRREEALSTYTKVVD
jgi:tetratricopeptide (TPR) repeat protein